MKKFTYFIACSNGDKGETIKPEYGYLFIDKLGNRYGASYNTKRGSGWHITELTTGLPVNIERINKKADIQPYIDNKSEAISRILSERRPYIERLTMLISKAEKEGMTIWQAKSN